MKNYRFYFYTVICLSVFFTLVFIFGIPYLLKKNGSLLLESEIESGRQQASQIASLSANFFDQKIEEETIKDNIQQVIDNTEKHNIFISVYDWSGKIISYPDITLVGDKASQKNPLVKNMETTISGAELYDYIVSLNDSDLTSNSSEIIYLTPINNSDWIIATHVNISNALGKINEWKSQTYLVFLIIALSVLLIVLGAIRFISGYYEGQLELKNSRLEDGVLSISRLNISLENYQKNLSEITLEKEPRAASTIEPVKETEKQRILTYVRNELMPISTEDIGYIYVENTITYIVRKDGKRSTTSESLDQIYSYLNENSFFRANRQMIVAISAINKITKFGNSKLKIQVNPPSEVDIIIGKNKASAFKQWLDL
ncbi:MAG: LytTR family transcriptional regulator [Flavobacteriaceae bacterium]|nr:LytTR family transcriptional regulator [Flavobacteriaceae bacterium]